jgi:hypothetical protein
VQSRLSNLETGSKHFCWIAPMSLLNSPPVIQILMNATNGLGIILENRYYGKSYPFNTSTTDELAFLTTEQSRCVKVKSRYPC